MPQPLLSIIVLSCNCAKYLPFALDSILRQGLSETQADIYLTCEASEDGSAAVCQQFVSAHPGARFVSLPKSGSPSCCRNWAIQNADGQYLLFLDGDDWLLDGGVAALLDTLAENGPLDILQSAAQEFYEDSAGNRTYHATMGNVFPEHRVFTGLEALSATRDARHFAVATWLCIYRTEFLRQLGILQTPGRRHEDVEWASRIFYYAQRVARCATPYYGYRQHAGTITSTPSPERIRDLALGLKTIFDFFGTHPVPPRHLSAVSAMLCDYCNIFFDPRYRSRFSTPLLRAALAEFLPDDASVRQLAGFARNTGVGERAEVRLTRLARHAYFPALILMRALHFFGALRHPSHFFR